MTDEQIAARLAERISNLAQSGVYDARRLADALLPFVWEVADQRAAAELNRVIEETACDPRMRIYAGMLAARAAALRGVSE